MEIITHVQRPEEGSVLDTGCVEEGLFSVGALPQIGDFPTPLIFVPRGLISSSLWFIPIEGGP